MNKKGITKEQALWILIAVVLAYFLLKGFGVI